ncbi:unnamed protein product [Cochlearia groenlandica]
MAKDHRQVIAVNDAVHKLQLAMLDGVTDQNQLFAAGTLISRYQITRTSSPSEPSWMGASNAVEDTKGSQSNQEKNTDLPSSKNDFTSTIIISDEYNVPKLPPQTKQASTTAKSEDIE